MTDSTADFLLYATIAIVYVTLMTMIVDRVLGGETLNEKCKFGFMPDMSAEEKKVEDKRQKECDSLRNEYQDKKFAHMIILGVVSMLVGAYAVTLDESYVTAGAGVALGGAFAVIYNSALNWYRIGTDLKILILGAALVTMVCGSIKLYAA